MTGVGAGAEMPDEPPSAWGYFGDSMHRVSYLAMGEEAFWSDKLNTENSFGPFQTFWNQLLFSLVSMHASKLCPNVTAVTGRFTRRQKQAVLYVQRTYMSAPRYHPRLRCGLTSL